MTYLIRKVASQYMRKIANEPSVEEGGSDGAKGMGVDPEIAKKVQKKLKGKTYKDKKSGKNIAFSTAYGRRHPSAVKDFGGEYIKELEKKRGGGGSSSKAAPKEDSSKTTPAQTNSGEGKPSQSQDTKPQKSVKKENPEQGSAKSLSKAESLVGEGRRDAVKKLVGSMSPEEQVKLNEEIERVGKQAEGLAKSNPSALYKEMSTWSAGTPSDVGATSVAKHLLREKMVNLVMDSSFDMDGGHFESTSGAKQREARASTRSKNIDRYAVLTSDERAKVQADLKKQIKEGDPTDPKVKALKDAAASVMANQVVSGGEGFDNVEPMLKKIATSENSSPEEKKKATEAIAESISVGRSETGKREVKRDHLNSLNPSSYKEAVGGSDGAYGGLVDLLEDGYCPNDPRNGDKGGSSSATCPFPLDDESKAAIKDFINMMVLDDDFFSGEGTSETKSSNIKEYMASDKGKDFEKALAEGDMVKIESHRAAMQGLRMGERSAGDKYQEHVKQEVEQKVKDWGDQSSISDLESAFDIERDEADLPFSFASDTPSSGSSGGGGKKASARRVAKVFLNISFMSTRKVYGGQIMSNRKASSHSNYQERVKAFSIGMRVSPYHGDKDKGGIVRAVFPAIGMVDVEFPSGTLRYPVEDLSIDSSGHVDNVPANEPAGGLGTAPVSAGRVASVHMKKTAIYWAGVDRKYRMRKDEDTAECPRCKVCMKPTSYKRRNGVSERLLGCPSCLFLIKRDDII